MSQTAKAQEPSMEEILASIRRIIADEDGGKPAKRPEPAPIKSPPPVTARPAPPQAPPAASNAQSDIDAKLAEPEPEPAAPAPPPKLAAAPPRPPAPPPSVLDLTEANVAPPPPAFHTIDGESDVVFAERAAVPIARAPEEPRTFDQGLISTDTAAAVDSAFNALAHTILGQNARTLEDLVKDMLRPMLKSWLDDNLPGLVERIVRMEIERVSRGKP
jgi:cell pole-organizing protein PopZ